MAELLHLIQSCLELCAALKSIPSPYQRMVSYDTQYIYSNDLKILQKLAKEHYLSRCELYEADVCLPAGVVQLKQSNHTMRSYFKDRCYNKEQMALLKNFLFNRLDTIRITPLFYHRLDSGRVHWLGRYFIDHSSEHDVLMLNLVLPNCIRKTMPIVCE